MVAQNGKIFYDEICYSPLLSIIFSYPNEILFGVYEVFFTLQTHLSVKVLICVSCVPSQQTFTCSSSTIETLQKNMKYVQS